LATHRIARNMLDQGLPIEIVVASTGLTREDVEKF